MEDTGKSMDLRLKRWPFAMKSGLSLALVLLIASFIPSIFFKPGPALSVIADPIFAGAILIALLTYLKHGKSFYMCRVCRKHFRYKMELDKHMDGHDFNGGMRIRVYPR